MKTVSHQKLGLTFIEVLIVIATVALLAGLLLPRISRPKVRANRIYCVMNLKEIGLAFRIFSYEHEEKPPWRVPRINGGAELPAAGPDPISQFLALGTNLSSPKVLACPVDERVVKSHTFAGISRNNLSYLISLEGDENQPQSLLSGDRNITGGTNSNGIYYLTPTSQAGWGTNMHHLAGNIGLGDGSAQQVLAKGLNKQLQSMTNETIRLLVP
ncbi:MAG: hypothetical protein JWM16_481 [Verrucomicrobiales bacterium]|nr:hypothetical protein [Verrucomicrobiales bacterium]